MQRFGWFIMAGMTMGIWQVEGSGPTGASLFWTCDVEGVKEARELVTRGELAQAEKRLADVKGRENPELAQAADEGKEIIRRIRYDYGRDLDSLLGQLRRDLPDVTAEDVERWRQAGQVPFRVLDGKTWYFGRAAGHVWLFCDEAKARQARHQGKDPAAPPPITEKDKRLIEHIEQVIASADRTGKTQVVPIRHTIHYKLVVEANRPGAKAGSLVRCWLPFAQEYRQQQNVKLLRSVPAEHVIAPNAVDRWPMQGAPQRTVYLEQKITDPSQPVTFALDFEYVSFAYYPVLDDAKARPLPKDFPAAHLEERPPHIVFTPQLKAAVREIVGDEKNPLACARKIFYRIQTMPWCAEEEYTIIPNFSDKILRLHKGDCGLHSMLFITMCRFLGIPARWQSGWETAPLDWNMHDWAEFYVAPWGWLPVDPTYGLKPSDNPKVREFYFGHQDAYRLIVNLDYGAPLQPPKEDLRSEPADFQRGEVEIDGRNLYFDEWDYEFRFDLQPLEERQK